MLAKSLFLLSLASLPLQLNKFFFPKSSLVLGLPIDYRALTVYLSDIFILLYIATFCFGNKNRFKRLFKQHRNFVLALFLLDFYLLASSLFHFKEPAFWLSIKTLEFSIFSLFTAIDLKRHFASARKMLVFSLVWQAGVVIIQFTHQASLGLRFLGERTFDVTTPNIAHFEVFGRQILRPYGTFPHPNVAAAFFTLGLIITNPRRFKLGFPLAALVLTFSRTAYFVIITGLAIIKRRPFILIVLVIIFAILLARPASDLEVASIAERITLAKAALSIAAENPLFGVGTGNFILKLANFNLISIAQIRLLQPVHNVFLLILAENGIVGLLLFGYLLITVAAFARTPRKIAILLALLVFASLDHFLWTLQQGQLLFWLAIAFIMSENRRNA